MIKVHRRPTADDLPQGYQFGDAVKPPMAYLAFGRAAGGYGGAKWRAPSENRAEILRGVAQRITEHTLHAGEP